MTYSTADIRTIVAGGTSGPHGQYRTYTLVMRDGRHYRLSRNGYRSADRLTAHEGDSPCNPEVWSGYRDDLIAAVEIHGAACRPTSATAPPSSGRPSVYYP